MAATAEIGRVLLFAGHMIDAPGRPKPRFPAEKEAIARQAIRQAILEEKKKAGNIDLGIAGAANGGDILFHEVCAELGIPTEVYLPLPESEYLEASVRKAGKAWAERFERLIKTVPVHHLDPSDHANLWVRNNQWLLESAFAAGGSVSVIALWNQEEGDGPGGTGDLVTQAINRGASPEVYDTKELFGL